MSGVLNIFLSGLVAFISTFGFALFMHTPKKLIVQASFTGGAGWMLYSVLNGKVGSIIASFFAACLVGICGEILARRCKAPSIVFIIPGMLPLAPGRGLYFTMENFIAKNYIEAISFGTTTLAIAGAISLGIIIVTSFARTISFKKYRVPKNEKISC